MTNDIVKNLCKIGQGSDCCRYLGMGPNGFECFKLEPGLKVQVDARVQANTMVAQGDNCEGKQNYELNEKTMH